MKRFSTRQRLMGGALLVAGLIAVVDRLTGGGHPAPAHANQTATQPAPPAPPGWPEVNELVARLTRADYTPVAGELAGLPRNLFTETPLLGAALAAAAPQPNAPPEPEPSPSRAPDFREQHRLVGVLIGKEPLAVIDDRLLPLNSELDGYRLIQIERDYVVFQEVGAERRVTLEIEQRPKSR